MGCILSHQEVDTNNPDVPYTSYISKTGNNIPSSPLSAYRRYVVVEKLNTCSQVFLYFDKESKTQVCVKRQKIGRATLSNDLSREIRLLTKLKSLGAPHVTECLDSFATRQYKMMVIPWRKHGDLFDWGKKHVLPEDTRKSIMRQLVKGLTFMHDNDMAHGDISLENVLIVNDNPLIVEWCDLSMGSEKHVHQRDLDRRGISWGKRDYMSPDVYYKNRPTYMAKADVWSLGVLFFLMGTGFKHVIYFQPEDQFWNRLLGKGFRKLYDTYFSNMAFPELLIDLIDHMLVEDTEKRYSIHDVCNHHYFNQ